MHFVYILCMYVCSVESLIKIITCSLCDKLTSVIVSDQSRSDPPPFQYFTVHLTISRSNHVSNQCFVLFC